MSDREDSVGRDRSRSRDREEEDHYGDSRRDREDHGENGNGLEENVFNLYVTNLSFQTTDESLRAAFESFGEVHNASVIKEPISQSSRGFGFVSYVSMEDSQKALDAMNGAEVDGRPIRVERARRTSGYQKTPGVYLGPTHLSSRFNRDRNRDRGGPSGGSRGGGYDRDRDRERDRSRDRGRDRGGFDRGYAGGAGAGFPGPARGGDDRYDYRAPPMYDRAPPVRSYRDERYMDSRGPPPPVRYEGRGYDGPRGGGEMPPYYDAPMRGGRIPPPDSRARRSRSPKGAPVRGRSPPPAYDRGYPSGGPGGYYPPSRRSPPGRY